MKFSYWLEQREKQITIYRGVKQDALRDEFTDYEALTPAEEDEFKTMWSGLGVGSKLEPEQMRRLEELGNRRFKKNFKWYTDNCHDAVEYAGPMGKVFVLTMPFDEAQGMIDAKSTMSAVQFGSSSHGTNFKIPFEIHKKAKEMLGSCS